MLALHLSDAHLCFSNCPSSRKLARTAGLLAYTVTQSLTGLIPVLHHGSVDVVCNMCSVHFSNYLVNV